MNPKLGELIAALPEESTAEAAETQEIQEHIQKVFEDLYLLPSQHIWPARLAAPAEGSRRYELDPRS